MKNDKTFTEEELKLALRDSIMEFNETFLKFRSESDKVLVNKSLLNLCGMILKNFGIDYTKPC